MKALKRTINNVKTLKSPKFVATMKPWTQKFLSKTTFFAIAAFLLTSAVTYTSEELKLKNQQLQVQRANRQVQQEINAIRSNMQHCINGYYSADFCVEQLRQWRIAIDKLTEDPTDESQEVTLYALLTFSFNVNEGKSHDYIVKYAKIYGFIQSADQYLTVNDPDHAKFRAALKNQIRN